MTVTNDPAYASVLDVVRAAAVVVMEVPLDGLGGATRWVEDLEADSLAMIEIVDIAEERMRSAGVNVRVDDATLAHLATLDELVTALRTRAEA